MLPMIAGLFGSMLGGGVSGGSQGGLFGGATPTPPADQLEEPGRWDKILSSISGDMEAPATAAQLSSAKNASQINQGVMSGARPQYGLSDFQSMFGDGQQQREVAKVMQGIMHPYIMELMRG